jgi:hypothetical protein
MNPVSCPELLVFTLMAIIDQSSRNKYWDNLLIREGVMTNRPICSKIYQINELYINF